MFCTSCGNQVSAEASFCQRCGARVIGVDSPPPVESPAFVASSEADYEDEDDGTSYGLVGEVIDAVESAWRSYPVPIALGAVGAGALLVWIIAVFANLGTIVFLAVVVGLFVLFVRSRSSSSSYAPDVIHGDVLVWRYGNHSDFERDAARLAEQGFVVVSVVDQQQRAGCTRILLLGFFALLWRPPARILVTYRRER